MAILTPRSPAYSTKGGHTRRNRCRFSRSGAALRRRPASTRSRVLRSPRTPPTRRPPPGSGREKRRSTSRASRVHLHPSSFPGALRDRIAEHGLHVPVAERRELWFVGHLACRDRRIDRPVELLERFGEAFGVSDRKRGRRARTLVQKHGIAEQHLVGPITVSQPQLLVPLRIPGKRALRTVDLEPQRVLPAGAHLRDDG